MPLKQAEAITAAITGVLNDSLENVSHSVVSKEEMQKVGSLRGSFTFALFCYVDMDQLIFDVARFQMSYLCKEFVYVITVFSFHFFLLNLCNYFMSGFVGRIH